MVDNADGLKNGIRSSHASHATKCNMQDHMPTEATPEILDAGCKTLTKCSGLNQDKNKIIKNHYQKLGVDSDKTTHNQSLLLKRQ